MTTGWIAGHWHRTLAHVAGLAPLAVLAVDWLRGALLPDPNRYLLLLSGSAGLLLLIAALACTPLNIVLGWRQAVQIRRTLGLYAFLYVSLHLLCYAVFDGLLDAELIWRDLGERPSMLAGFLAFLALVPLALTSTSGWQRRLGRRWRTLHRLVYPAALLSALHFLWLERDYIQEAVVYAVVIGALLVIRLPWVRRAIVRGRARFTRPPVVQR
ncbi:MAG TPA: protein-methionine-sulfoxide reductase heme-binding subunit MsrQ [Roseiflexaceae bacterium]|nr:protein-methionine-sulfoxide reductase heme-binding subunit MsrQ [Roseiflexaceae bacterium]